MILLIKYSYLFYTDELAVTAANEKRAAESAADVAWANSDRDYTYQELLTRALDTLRQRNPDMVSTSFRIVVLFNKGIYVFPNSLKRSQVVQKQLLYRHRLFPELVRKE